MHDRSEDNKRIDILRTPSRSFFSRGIVQKKLEVLEYYAAHGLPGHLWFLSECLDDKDARIRDKTAEVMIAIFSGIRSHEQLYAALGNLQLSKHSLSRCKVDFPEAVSFQLLAMASFNRNGYVREYAVSLLAQSGRPAAISYLLFRTADWVKPVREKAIAAVHESLVDAWYHHWLQALPMVKWLLTVQRVDLSDLYRTIVHFLLTRPLDAATLRSLSANEKIRKLLFQLQLSAHGLTTHLQQLLLADSNFLIRLEILSYLRSLPDSEQEQLLRKLLRDASARVRMATLLACKPHLDPLWDDIEPLLYDPAASVRDMVRRYAASRGLPVQALYRARLLNNPVTPGLLMGLGETGTAEDSPAIEAHLSSTEMDIPPAALFALYRLDKDLAAHYALIMVGSPSRCIRLRCIAILAKGCDEAMLARLRLLYALGNLQQRKTVLLLFGALSGWDPLADLLLAVGDPLAQMRALAWQQLATWLRRSVRLFTTPAPSVMDRVKQAYVTIEAAKMVSAEQAELWRVLKGCVMDR